MSLNFGKRRYIGVSDVLSLSPGEDRRHDSRVPRPSLKHRLTGRRAGVEALRFQEEVDARGVQFTEERYQVLQTAAEAIDR